MALEVRQIADKVEALKRRNAERDTRMANVLSVRRGQISNVYPDFFPEGMTQPMIANFIDVAARDLAEVLAPLPSFNCTTFNVTSDRAKAQAEKRSMIVNYYAHSSRLQTQMYTGADWYLTYGFLPIVVEIDVESNQPRIRLDNPLGAYPEFDRFGRLSSYTRRYYKTLAELIVEFPEYESQLIGPGGRDNVDLYAMVEMVKYEDAEQILLFVPQKSNLVLKRTPNPIGEMMVRVARRPSIDDDMRGQFDDVVWVQLARARFSLLALEAAEKSVQAPLALPNDVQELAFGPDAVLRSQNPQQIRRVGLELPNAAFTEQAVLQQEMRLGARYPEGRTGNIDASIITGQVEVRYGLMAGLDPSRALIFSLQAMGGDLVSREFVMSELPWALNVSKEQERIDVQRMRDNLNKAIESSAAALPEMIATGQSPAKLILQLSEIITARQNGTSIEEAAKKVFAEPEPTPVEGLPQQVVAQPSPTSAPAPSTGATPPQAPNIAQILGQIAG